MSGLVLTRAKASKLALAAQAGAATAAVLGVVVLLVAPGASATRAERVDAGEIREVVRSGLEKMAARAAAEETTDEVASFPVDVPGLTERLVFASGVTPKAEEPPQQASAEDRPAAQTEPTAQEQAAAEPSRVKFLGLVRFGERSAALLSVGPHQKFMKPGERHEFASPSAGVGRTSVELVSIADNGVEIIENEVERTIERADRSGKSFAVVAAPAAPAADPNAAQRARQLADRARRQAGDPPETEVPEPIRPEDYKRPDGTIDYEALRKAARERANILRQNPQGASRASENRDDKKDER